MRTASRLLVALLLAGPALAGRAVPAAAQALRPGLLTGRVLDENGQPVGNAVLRATLGARTILVEGDADGDYRIGGLSAGVWLVSVRRLGYRPVALEVVMPAEGLRRDLFVETARVALDPVLVAAKWTGVRGIVGDARRITPLPGATVSILGSDASAGADPLGQFALAVPGGRTVLLRVKRAGYATRLVSVRVPAERYLDVELGLDTLGRPSRDLWIWRDLDQRLKYATPRAALVDRDELEASDAVSLGTALQLAASVQKLGLVVNRRACVFVNGVPKPAYPVDAILAGNVEFVEVYPPGSELTRTLALKWPPGATCGVPDGTIRAPSAGARQVAQFVSVWLRAP